MTDERREEASPYLTVTDPSFDAVDTLDDAAAREQAATLRAAIRHHDEQYYVHADPDIPDRTYDVLFSRLEALETAFDLDTTASPTQRVGGEPLDEFDTVEHVAPMRSVASSGAAEEVRAFDERVRTRLGLGDGQTTLTGEASATVQYFCQPKFDGVAVELVYEDGVLTRATTRGDGDYGDDITANIRTVRSVPLDLVGDAPEFLAVRGEVFMPRDAFQQYNHERVENGEEPFANPRNATAGTVRQLDPAVVAERPLACYVFGVLDATYEFDTHHNQHVRLGDWGLPTAPRSELVDGIDPAIEYRDALVDAREDLNYEIDGAVIKVDSVAWCAELGSTSRAPRWSFAYKLPARTEETTVRDIVVQTGRTGRITPVALLDPVDVGGVTVSRATLHNPQQIRELGVDVGDTVAIERAGDVIPYVDRVVNHASDRAFEFPERCPTCTTPLVRDGPQAFCPAGFDCPAQRHRALKYYVSREGLDIDGLGDERLTQLIDTELVTSLADLYHLRAADLARLDGWGQRSAENVIKELDAATEPPLDEFLTALGIPDIGPTTARALARAFGTFDALRTAETHSLQQVDDVGPEVAASFRSFFDTEQNARAVDALLDAGVSPQPIETADGDTLDGLTFVFTGSLDGLTRSEAQSFVERHGANATSSVSGNTDYLVAGANAGQSKQTAADENDVPVLDQATFEQLLRDDHGLDISALTSQ
jgi:DNA ligase (NAD+)